LASCIGLAGQLWSTAEWLGLARARPLASGVDHSYLIEDKESAVTLTPNNRRSARLLVTALAAFAFIANAVATPLAAQAAGASWFVARSSNKCMGVAGASTAPGAKVIQWPCVDVLNQHWYLASHSSGWYLIVNNQTGRCLAPENGSTNNGAQMTVVDCNHADRTQLWHPSVTHDDGTHGGTWLNAGSWKCLGVLAGSTANGAKVIQWDCNGNPDQDWFTDV
jgi:cytochrome c